MMAITSGVGQNRPPDIGLTGWVTFLSGDSQRPSRRLLFYGAVKWQRITRRGNLDMPVWFAQVKRRAAAPDSQQYAPGLQAQLPDRLPGTH